MSDFDKAMRDPSKAYSLPKDILEDDTLDQDQKIKILKQWEFDAHNLMVAEEENMPGDAPPMLNRVRRALKKLEAG